MNKELNKLSTYHESGRILLRDVNYDGYPEVSDSLAFSFSRTNFFRCTQNELQLLSRFGTALISRNGFWQILRSENDDLGENESVFQRAKIKLITLIDESLITRVDMDGDEYHPEPQVYLDIPDAASWFAPFNYLRHANNELLDPTKRMW